MPVGGFNIGQGVANARAAHAGATSVSGIGGAIRGILEDARAKGLLQSKSATNISEAFATHGLEQDKIRLRGDVARDTAIDTAAATQPFELEKIGARGDAATQTAIDAARGTLPIEMEKIGARGDAATQTAIESARGTQPFKLEAIGAQSAGNLETAKQAAQFKDDLSVQRAAKAGTQPTPQIFTDPDTGKTMVKNYSFDKNSGQWVAKVSPASFDLLERITGGVGGLGGVDPVEAKLDQIITNIFAEE